MKYSIYLNRRVFVMKNEFESGTVNELSLFESLKFYGLLDFHEMCALKFGL